MLLTIWVSSIAATAGVRVVGEVAMVPIRRLRRWDGGQVTAPVVNRAQIVVTNGDPQGYRDGDQVAAGVGVD